MPNKRDKTDKVIFKRTSLNDSSTAEALYIFCLMWSLGAALDEESREEFDIYVKELSNLTFKQNVEATEKIQTNQLPAGAIKAAEGSGIGEQTSSTLFDFYFDLRVASWISWSNYVNPYIPPRDGRFSSIFVETLDTKRNTWIVSTFATQKR